MFKSVNYGDSESVKGLVRAMTGKERTWVGIHSDLGGKCYRRRSDVECNRGLSLQVVL